MTPAELAKKDEFYSIYWSEYNFVKENGSSELREMPDYLDQDRPSLKPEHKINIVRKEKMSIGVVAGGTFDFSSEVQNFMIRFIIETIMPIYRKRTGKRIYDVICTRRTTDMSMNVSTTTAAYANYQNNYKTGTANKKKETAQTTENTKLKENTTESIAEKNLSKAAQKCWRICVDQETTWILWLPILKMVIMPKIF